MSTPAEKYKNAARRFRDEKAVKRQTRILKSHGPVDDVLLKEPHRYHKQHSLNCGNPSCFMCANPRKIFKEKTIQEQRFYQDIDSPNDKHSNGLNLSSDTE